MSDVEMLVKEKLVSLKKQAINALAEKNPQLYSLLNIYLTGKKYRFGLQITEDGRKVDDFTILSEGLDITEVQSGVLSPEVQHPFGVIKPYAIIEKDALEKMLQDEHAFVHEPFTMLRKYISDITIKFMR
ncbi:hypothetical protein [Desulfoscipio gibsoniae]|uniref:Uncharacterized protein n=1 Tax=Desulfoscipio gibsoniae DSM 7213 TaxID=767817 RepID=R4KFV5_9FIRM|nr:hypothetical protein [Desulfoscipio gibsoniae]AGL00517.1 hypothetical protein Desgi_0977 [Desulfoscipio gibsoniae DSM 7213]